MILFAEKAIVTLGVAIIVVPLFVIGFFKLAFHLAQERK